MSGLPSQPPLSIESVFMEHCGSADRAADVVYDSERYKMVETIWASHTRTDVTSLTTGKTRKGSVSPFVW